MLVVVGIFREFSLYVPFAFVIKNLLVAFVKLDQYNLSCCMFFSFAVVFTIAKKVVTQAYPQKLHCWPPFFLTFL